MRNVVLTLREAMRELTSVRGVEVVIDGRSVPLSQLSDEEVDALLPELVG